MASEIEVQRRIDEAVAMANARNTGVPQNASQYMNPKLLIKERAIVLPVINAPANVIRTEFIDLLKSSAFGDLPGECLMSKILACF